MLHRELFFAVLSRQEAAKARQDEANAKQRLHYEENRWRGFLMPGLGSEEELRLLRNSVARHSATIRQWEQVLNQHQPESQLQSEVDNLQARLQRKQADLKRAETPPPAVFQPLPESDDSAKAVIFFLYTPDLLRSLSRMTILAEQLLLPWPWRCEKRWLVCSAVLSVAAVCHCLLIMLQQAEVGYDGCDRC